MSNVAHPTALMLAERDDLNRFLNLRRILREMDINLVRREIDNLTVVPGAQTNALLLVSTQRWGIPQAEQDKNKLRVDLFRQSIDILLARFKVPVERTFLLDMGHLDSLRIQPPEGIRILDVLQDQKIAEAIKKSLSEAS